MGRPAQCHRSATRRTLSTRDAKKGHTVPTTTADLQTNARRKEARAVELRLAGATYDSIAQQVGYANRGGARRAIQRAIRAEWEASPREELRQQVLARLQRLTLSHWQAAQTDPRRAAIVLQALDRITKLTGVDLPQQISVRVTSELDDEIEQLMTQLRSASVTGGQAELPA